MLYIPVRQPLIRRWAQGMIDRSAWYFLACKPNQLAKNPKKNLSKTPR